MIDHFAATGLHDAYDAVLLGRGTGNAVLLRYDEANRTSAGKAPVIQAAGVSKYVFETINRRWDYEGAAQCWNADFQRCIKLIDARDIDGFDDADSVRKRTAMQAAEDEDQKSEEARWFVYARFKDSLCNTDNLALRYRLLQLKEWLVSSRIGPVYAEFEDAVAASGMGNGIGRKYASPGYLLALPGSVRALTSSV